MHQKIGGRRHRFLAKLYHMRIYHKYGCCIFRDAVVESGFWIPHPIGVVIGRCHIGKNVTILQGVTVGEKNLGEWNNDPSYMPMIGNNVTLAANVCVLGKVCIGDNIVVGANSVVCSDILKQGNYVGAPAHLISK